MTNVRLLVASTMMLFSATALLRSQSTISALDHQGYSSNTGWVDFRPSATNGVAVGQFYCTGWAYDANTGWIHLGAGFSPANGHTWSNTSAGDFGVNHDGLGSLRGQAWSPNTGWVNFEATGNPRVDLRTGRMNGYAWNPNTGWLSLSNTFAQVKTDSFAPGPDSDFDGLPDAWEYARVGHLGLSGSSNPDNDHTTTYEEYIADTDPQADSSNLNITFFSWLPASTPLTWTSRPTRFYTIERSPVLLPPGGFSPVTGLVDLSPSPGATTSAVAPADLVDRGYYRVRAKLPLAP